MPEDGFRFFIFHFSFFIVLLPFSMNEKLKSEN